MPTMATVGWEVDTTTTEEWIETKAPDSNWCQANVTYLPDACSDERQTLSDRLQVAIKQLTQISALDDDWDGEGSPAYSPQTVNRARIFLAAYVRTLWVSRGVEPTMPRIAPGPDGTIDIHWKQPTWELLVNIPAHEREMAAFYGDNYGAQKIRGSFDLGKFNLGIAEWLTQ
jgi:hypothetical protein